MSLCIRFGRVNSDVANGELTGFFYISAVTNYSQVLKSTLTKHPLDSGVSISDHVFSDNPVYNIEGVISSVDISSKPSVVNNLLRTINSVDTDDGTVQLGRGVINGVIPPQATNVDEQTSGLRKFLPDVIDQFIPQEDPEIVGSEVIKPNYGNHFINIVYEIMTKITFNQKTNLYNNSATLCALYEMNDNNYIKVHDNLVVTSCQFNENQESGDGLFFSMTLEKARFTYIEIDRSNTAIEMTKKVQKKKNKGKVDSTTKNKTENSKDAEKDKNKTQNEPTSELKIKAGVLIQKGKDAISAGRDLSKGNLN